MTYLSRELRAKYRISRCWLEIDLDKLKSNIEFLRSLKSKIGDDKIDEVQNNLNSIRSYQDDVKLTAVVKADAYGHGAKVIAKFLDDENLVDRFAVASIDEAISLREIGVSKDILIQLKVLGKELTP